MIVRVVGDLHIAQGVSTRTDNYLETCLNKLRQVLEGADVVFCLGDFFNTPVVNTEIVSEVYSLLKEYPNTEVYTILGNHDVYNMNENSVYKTSLGLLELVGAIKILKENDIVELGEGLVFEAMPLNFKDLKKNCHDLFFLGHHFYNLNCQDSLNDDMLKELYPNAEGFFFGHDHQYYEPTNNVYRPGSLLRNANTDYNRVRKPIYYQITTEEYKQGLPFREVPIQCLDGKDVFVDNMVIKKREKFIASLERTIQLCSEKVDTETKYSMLEILKEIKTPRKAYEYISQTCKVVGVNLK